MLITLGPGWALHKRRMPIASLLVALLLLPGTLTAQQDIPMSAPPENNAMRDATHATRPAPDELLQQAAQQPTSFIGKTLVLQDAQSEVEVGRVLDVRRRRQNEEIYLIVDATRYFNAETEYAVAVKDVDRMEGNRLVVSEAPGMHLRGIEYYADDYTSVEAQGPQ